MGVVIDSVLGMGLALGFKTDTFKRKKNTLYQRGNVILLTKPPALTTYPLLYRVRDRRHTIPASSSPCLLPAIRQATGMTGGGV